MEARERNCQEPTLALRTRSLDRLRSDLNAYLVASEPVAGVDARDVMVGLAPYIDCAQRLGVDPVDLFERASRDTTEGTRELARTFARRSDVTLRAFGWELATTSDGPCYRAID